MNAPERLPLPDVQASLDTRQIAINRVGIRRVRYPITVPAPAAATAAAAANGSAGNAGSAIATVAMVDMYVGLPSDQKGTHMSRFLEILEQHGRDLSDSGVARMFENMLARLGAQTGVVEMRFPVFIEKTAPVSGVNSLMDYDVTVRREKTSAQGATDHWLQVLVPVTSLCPCSKDISAYGAHNQRSHVTIQVLLQGATAFAPSGGLAPASGLPVTIHDLVAVAERAASCELYGLLKRTDEKYVTERAYDNPKFVEDLVRDIALELQSDARIAAFTVEAENFESIHNHSAYARIDVDKRKPNAGIA